MSERAYTTVDKRAWGPGPWQDEPDKVQWKDPATGLPCLANRSRSGAWCGYVGVAPGHPAHEKGYDDVYDLSGSLEVHGGLTYSRHCQHGPEELGVCHVPDPGEPDDVWWLGFDCAQSGDVCPAFEALDLKRCEETGDPIWLSIPSPWGESYRTLDYVRRETTRLAEQLASLAAAS